MPGESKTAKTGTESFRGIFRGNCANVAREAAQGLLRLSEAGVSRNLAAISHSKAVFNQSELKPTTTAVGLFLFFFINRLSIGRASVGGRAPGGRSGAT